jgi:acyl-coenzyme A synthetase/AMP-(fatty) acid ligase
MIDWWGPMINEYYGATETGIVVWHNSAEALKKPGASLPREDSGKIFKRKLRAPYWEKAGRSI